MDNDTLTRARSTLESARLTRGIGDVGHEVAAVRTALADANAVPEDIGTSDAELDGYVRDGLLAEARTIFDLAAHGCDFQEKGLYFDHILELVTRSVKIGMAMDEAAAAALRENDPCAGQTEASREETSALLADVDVDRLEFDFAAAQKIPDDDPEITIVRTESLAPGDALEEDNEETIEVGEDEILEEVPADCVSGVRQVSPPPLPRRDSGLLAAGDCQSSARLYMDGESPDGPPSFSRYEEAWFAKAR